MKFKNLVILIGVLIALMGILILKQETKPHVAVVEKPSDIVSSPLILENITEAVIQFGQTEKQSHLVKKDGRWELENLYGVYADENLLSNLFKKLDTISGELRSDDPVLLGDYGITDARGIHILLRDQTTELAHLVVGSKRAGYSGNFVRHQDQNSVYVIEDDLLSELGLWGEVKEENFKADRWLDQRVTHFDPEDVAGIKVSRKNKTSERIWFDLQFKDIDGQKKWVSSVEYPFGLSATKIKNYFRSFENIRAREVTAPQPTGVFEDSSWKAEIVLENGQSVTLTRGGKDEQGDDYYVKTVDDYYFLVPVSTFDGFTGGSGDLFVSNPLGVQDAQVTKINVQDLTAKKKFSASRSLNSDADVVWTAFDGKELDKNKIQEIIRGFKDLNVLLVSADDVPAPNDLAVKITQGALRNALRNPSDFQDSVPEISREKFLGAKHSQDLVPEIPSEFQGEALKTYTLSQSQKLEDGRDCYFLRVEGDPNHYCYLQNNVTNFKNTIPFTE